ncbi:hypothetical protein BT96DRAFT_481204 [Gymnopus androsaceus JB14]|uniref:Uncharacterized protein n=1 Tax=Gymnopus androsaceus JB14 TaxID=1447944 RepID=A0A6A4I0Y0_9AGAR|nr:hypothetical protein BT96DRAFT_481204 [Gymnopus androsaceus JB14]
MTTVADLQQAIFRLYEARLAQVNLHGSKQRIQQESLVQEVMEYLQAELDSTRETKSNDGHPFFGTTGVYYKKCLRTLRQLSVTYKVLPTSLVMCNVKSDGRPAVGGGGLSEIYHGTMVEQRVCIKVP